MKRALQTLGLLLVLVLSPALVMAQGQSAIEVNRIAVSPDPFRLGNSLTVRIDIQNTGAARTNPGTAYLDLFKAETYLASDRVRGSTQPVSAMNPGETRQVTFSLTVPNVDTDKFVFRTGVVDPPNEFAQMASVTFPLTPMYGSKKAMMRLPRTPIPKK